MDIRSQLTTVATALVAGLVVLSACSADNSAVDGPTAESSLEAADSATALPEGSGCGNEVNLGQSDVSFTFEERERSYQLYVPTGYNSETPTPVVLNWHGLGSTGPQQLVFSEYAELADAEGFIVVNPTGVPSPGDQRNSWEITDDADPTRDDIAFAEHVIDRLIATMCVDENRVFTTGMSNGGYFSSRLVCELSDRIAAAATVAGLTHPDDCRPANPVPMLAFHGVDDDIVPFNGGGFSTLAPGVRIPLFELVIPDEFAEFAADFGCGPDPTEDAITPDVVAFTYTGCDDGVEAVFYQIGEAGHTWPGSDISSSSAGLGVTNTDINATELSWQFFVRNSS